MLVRGHFAICVFALHATVCSSAAALQAPHHQPPNQWILGCRCLQLLWLCLVQPRLWPQSQWNLGLWSLQRFGVRKNEFPIRLTTAGQVTKSVWAGIALPSISLPHWAYTTRVLITSGRLSFKDQVETGGWWILVYVCCRIPDLAGDKFTDGVWDGVSDTVVGSTLTEDWDRV